MTEKKIYYARSKSVNGTLTEERDISLLKSLGFNVLNESSDELLSTFLEIKKDKEDNEDNNYQAFEQSYGECIRNSNALAFKRQLDGFIGAGVFKEIQLAKSIGLPIIEIPSGILNRVATVEQTRAYLEEIGQR